MAKPHQAEIPRWPESASTDYIIARKELLVAECALDTELKRVAALRQALPPGAIVKDYTFEEASAGTELSRRKLTLHQLVPQDPGRSLVVYHLMFHPADTYACGSCSMCVDGFNGVAQHLARNIEFAVIAKAPTDKLQTWAKKRRWSALRLFSSYHSDFDDDMGVEHLEWTDEKGRMPGTGVFKREASSTDGDVVGHVYWCGPHWHVDDLGGTYFDDAGLACA